MSRALTFYSTSIGKKVVMAITGLILFGFVIGHMLGNLQVFMGANQMNAYAAMLKANATLLWSVRIVLLVAMKLTFASLPLVCGTLPTHSRPTMSSALFAFTSHGNCSVIH